MTRNKLSLLLLRKRFYVFLGFAGFIAYTYSILELRLSENAYRNALKTATHEYLPTINSIDTLDRTVSYLELGNDSLPLLFLIHGAPSSSASWMDLYRDSFLLTKVKMVAPDRLGYGYSGLGREEVTMEKQAAALVPILRKMRAKHDHILVLGSSYGGPVAAKLAMDYPELVDGLMLMSASLEPGAEKTYAITYPTSHWSLKYLIPKVFKVANAEKLAHREALEAIENDWKKIEAVTTIFHGNQDNLIYYSNAQFAFDNIINAPHKEFVTVINDGHGMLWSRTALVTRHIINAMERTVYYHTK